MLALQVIAPDFHFLGRQMIKGQVKFQNRGLGVFAVGVAFDHGTQGLKRLIGQTLITPDQINLVIIADGQNILRIGRIFVPRIGVDIALCRRAGQFVFFVFVVRKRLHDQRALGPFRIGVKALDLAKPFCRFVRVATLKIIFAALEDLFCAPLIDRAFFNARAKDTTARAVAPESRAAPRLPNPKLPEPPPQPVKTKPDTSAILTDLPNFTRIITGATPTVFCR